MYDSMLNSQNPKVDTERNPQTNVNPMKTLFRFLVLF